MQVSILLIGLLAVVIAVTIVAKRFEFPYPIAFVLGGALIAALPHLPEFRIRQDLVFLLILPPLLYSGGWSMDLNLFRRNLRPILQLAIGLVIATTVAVALAAHAFLPALGWGAAFALGAIVSPPDAVAAGAVFERFPVPRTVAAILSGEGLVNDGVALVIYQFAVAATVTGLFSPGRAAVSFVVVAVGGIAIGTVLGFAFTKLAVTLRRFELTDPLISNVLLLLAPYATYLAADSLHVSGVLATVVAGAIGGRKSASVYDAESRLIGSSVWQLLIFLLNGLVFVLIGLQLRTIVLAPNFELRTLWLGLIVSGLLVVVRIAWVFPVSFLSRVLIKGITRRTDEAPQWRYVFIVAWSGMRGIISLASALALPLTLANGAAFPARDTIIFVTFCAIFVTLVVQGITLIPILKWLKIDAGEDVETQEIEIRVTALRAGIARLRELEPSFDSTVQWEIEGRLLAEYEHRIGHLNRHNEVRLEPGDSFEIDVDHDMQQQALHAERREILRMRDRGEIPDEIYRNVELDLDLATARLT